MAVSKTLKILSFSGAIQIKRLFRPNRRDDCYKSGF
jgi:hypothetical protein